MLRDQTIAEVSASGGAYRVYLCSARLAVARQMRSFRGDDPSAEIAFAATDLLAPFEPMIAAAGQRHGTGMDDPVRQIEPAFASATEPWPPATR
jgi:hypothetical protein